MDFSRNIGIFTEEQQATLAEKSLVVLGVGLGGNIAELATRTGFSKITVVDGDQVSPSNLNRQVYTSSDAGINKTLALQSRLLAINPSLTLNVVDSFLRPEEVSSVLKGADIIVDTIDLSSVEVILAVHEYARANKVPVVFPINLGWTSMATAFTDKSVTLQEFMSIGEETIDQAKAKDFSFWAKFLGRFVPEYGQGQFEAFLEKASRMDDWCPAPQLGVTVAATASIVTSYCVKIALGLPYKVAPEVVTVDLFLQ